MKKKPFLIIVAIWFLRKDNSWRIYQIDWGTDESCTDEPHADETPVENAHLGS